jgi:hypothetical protein
VSGSFRASTLAVGFADQTSYDVRGGVTVAFGLERDDFSSNRHPALAYCWSMIFSENRYPLFGIML